MQFATRRPLDSPIMGWTSWLGTATQKHLKWAWLSATCPAWINLTVSISHILKIRAAYSGGAPPEKTGGTPGPWSLVAAEWPAAPDIPWTVKHKKSLNSIFIQVMVIFFCIFLGSHDHMPGRTDWDVGPMKSPDMHKQEALGAISICYNFQSNTYSGDGVVDNGFILKKKHMTTTRMAKTKSKVKNTLVLSVVN